jgi:hypothetical protein
MKAGELKTALEALSASADKIRGEIVATKEGGAITGEERLRENMDKLYGVLRADDVKPTAAALARIDALSREQADIGASIAKLVAGDLAAANQKLAAAKLGEIKLPPKGPATAEGGGGEGSPKQLQGFKFSLRGQATAVEAREARVERD